MEEKEPKFLNETEDKLCIYPCYVTWHFSFYRAGHSLCSEEIHFSVAGQLPRDEMSSDWPLALGSSAFI